MPLPVVQEKTLFLVQKEMRTSTNFGKKMLTRLRKENPRIALLVVAISKQYNKLMRFRLLNILMAVYRMLEIQNKADIKLSGKGNAKLPFLKNEGIFYSVLHTMNSNPQFYTDAINKLQKENGRIVSFVIDETNSNHCDYILLAVVVVYMVLESQQEVDEMEQE